MSDIQELNYYSLNRILEYQAEYYVIFGERSTGKTYSVKELIIKNALLHNEDGAIIRRFDIDMRGRRSRTLFDDIVVNNLVEKYSNGKWTHIYYWSDAWYFCKYDERGRRIRANEPFCYAFTLSAVEHDKSTSYPKITTILFDEFITRQIYLPNEYVLFQNQVSTIVRHRDNVKIFLCGNSVNKYGCIYFKEMGLRHIDEMSPGDISFYQQGKDGARIVVEYTGSISPNGKASDKYFAFDNPRLEMITKGKWETAMYPHLFSKYKSTDIIGTFFIVYEEHILQCEIIQVVDICFLYIHVKTTPLQDKDADIIFSPEYNPRSNWIRKITNLGNKVCAKILWFFKNDKVCYQDNDIGELVRSYYQWCTSDRGILNN